MPKQHRWIIKRNLDQAIAHIDGAIDDIVIVGSEFNVVHPEYYQAFTMVVTNLYKIRASIAEIKDLI